MKVKSIAKGAEDFVGVGLLLACFLRGLFPAVIHPVALGVL